MNPDLNPGCLTAPTITATPFLAMQPDAGQPRCRVACDARFTAPDGAVTTAQVVLFQLDDGRVGVAVYPSAARGAVLRWDHGPATDPAVIYWQAPHCAEDQCGTPCGHQEASR